MVLSRELCMAMERGEYCDYESPLAIFRTALESSRWRLYDIVASSRPERALPILAQIAIDQDLADTMRSRAQKTGQDILKKLWIDSPGQDCIVSVGDVIKGTTPFQKWNHYITIAVSDTMMAKILVGPIHINRNGSWEAAFRLDRTHMVKGRRYEITMLATPAQVSDADSAAGMNCVYGSQTVTAVLR